jgi:hypothetical protein
LQVEKRMTHFYRATGLMLIMLMLGVSCSHSPQVRATLDDVLSDPGAYKDCELIIPVSIKDVLENHSLYQERRIEVTGELVYSGSRSFWTWYLMVADGERQLRCYTNYYRVSVGRDAEVMMKRAAIEKKPLTINGVLRNDGIDIREILYEGQMVRPKFKPPVLLNVPGSVY